MKTSERHGNHGRRQVTEPDADGDKQGCRYFWGHQKPGRDGRPTTHTPLSISWRPQRLCLCRRCHHPTHPPLGRPPRVNARPPGGCSLQRKEPWAARTLTGAPDSDRRPPGELALPGVRVVMV